MIRAQSSRRFRATPRRRRHRLVVRLSIIYFNRRAYRKDLNRSRLVGWEIFRWADPNLL